LVNDDGSANNNTALGYNALNLATTAAFNVAVGYQAMDSMTTSYGYSTAVGYQALGGATTGFGHVAIGYMALNAVTGGENNTAVGREAGKNATGQASVFIGYEAGDSATGSNAVFIGMRAGRNAPGTTSGILRYSCHGDGKYCDRLNVPLGYQAGDIITTGYNNTALGNLIKDTTATEDYVLTVDASGEAGWEAAGGGGATDIDGLSDAITNSSGQTIGLGTGALVNDDGSTRNNTALGYNALNAATTGDKNTAVGNGAGSSLTGAAGTTFIGYHAGLNATGDENTAVGAQAMQNVISGAGTGKGNIAIGYQTLLSTTGQSPTHNIAIGNGAGRGLATSGNYNNLVGTNAGIALTTGGSNTAMGYASLAAGTTGSGNVALGHSALGALTTSGDNTAIGRNAGTVATGSNNTFVGSGAGDAQTSGNNNIILGYNADGSSTTVSNEITLGNASIATLRCQVTSITALSDRRDKKDIVPLELGLDFVNSLNPVKFTWNTRDGAKVGQQEAGFIAQELDEAQVAAGAETYLDIVLKENLDKLEAAPGKLIPVLVKAIQDLSAEVATLKEKINAR
jgi:trimeric autotransporter adhesin